MKNRFLFAAALFSLSAIGAHAFGDPAAKSEPDVSTAKAVATDDKAVPVAAKLPMAVGEIQKIDKATGKVTIKHGEIKNIDMPPMTMVFRVKDAAMLDSAKVGDKINFQADKINGNFTVTKIESAK